MGPPPPSSTMLSGPPPPSGLGCQFLTSGGRQIYPGPPGTQFHPPPAGGAGPGKPYPAPPGGPGAGSHGYPPSTGPPGPGMGPIQQQPRSRIDPDQMPNPVS